MKTRAPRNRTVTLKTANRRRLERRLLKIDGSAVRSKALSGTIHGDCLQVLPCLPQSFVDLLILDPPYNMNKNFNGRKFSQLPVDTYTARLRDLLGALMPVLKDTATVYVCGDWRSSPSIYSAASELLIVRNRITWEREKGRASSRNWKNAAEDIWFCTVSDEYTFNPEAVRLRRKVIAPYRVDGRPKDWRETTGGNFRDTAPSNLWTDITVPFWSMSENTDHPTQKSEKLIAKLILASTNPDDLVFDPFLGSGTTSVVARKLGRRYLGIEIDRDYCLMAEHRLDQAETDKTIQGYTDEIFWERNTLAQQNKSESK